MDLGDTPSPASPVLDLPDEEPPKQEEAAPLVAADGHEEDENILVAQVCVKQVHGLKNFSCGAKIGCTTGSRRHTKKHFVDKLSFYHKFNIKRWRRSPSPSSTFGPRV